MILIRGVPLYIPITLYTAVDCGTLLPPVNGVVDQSQGTQFRAVALYSCQEGYVLTPAESASRTCTDTGKWSGSEPKCESEYQKTGLYCVLPSSEQCCGFYHFSFSSLPSHPSLSFTPLPLPSPPIPLSSPPPPLPHLHTLSANSVRDATIDCGDLSPPTNGEVVLLNSSTGEGALAQYRCRAGYMVVGMEIRQCQMSGKWDGEAPMCIGE